MRIGPSRSRAALPDDPTFTLVELRHGWQVQITWEDGEEGPAIAFVSRDDALTWITRDSRDWLSRLAALASRDNEG